MSSGKVAFKLTSAFDFPRIVVGVVIAQMIAADTIKVQAFPNVTADTIQFDANASIYTR
jgi:hypothetical protein